MEQSLQQLNSVTLHSTKEKDFAYRNYALALHVRINVRAIKRKQIFFSVETFSLHTDFVVPYSALIKRIILLLISHITA